MRFRLPSIVAGFATLALLAPHTAFAQGAEGFYKGKTVTILIGYSVGGSDDLWARLIARHMGRFLPGQPVVTPQNMPGAGSLVAANQIYNTAPKDGTVLGMINRGVPFEPMLGNKSAQFDPLKFTYIGSPDRDVIVGYIRADAPLKHAREMRTQELIVAATGSGADSYTYPNVLKNLFNLNIRVVSGYPGSRDMNLAVERNEVHATFISYDTAAREPNFANGSRKIFLQGTMTPDPRMPDVPTLGDLARDDEDKRAMELFLYRAQMGRPVVAPPDLPAERASSLRKAFVDTLGDAQAREEAQKQMLNVNIVPPQELTELVRKAYSVDQKTIARVTAALR